MIENEEIAAKISDLMIEYYKKISESITLVKENCPPEEFKSYRLASAKVLAPMILEVMDPLYAKHPHLKPTALR